MALTVTAPLPTPEGILDPLLIASFGTAVHVLDGFNRLRHEEAWAACQPTALLDPAARHCCASTSAAHSVRAVSGKHRCHSPGTALAWAAETNRQAGSGGVALGSLELLSGSGGQMQAWHSHDATADPYGCMVRLWLGLGAAVHGSSGMGGVDCYYRAPSLERAASHGHASASGRSDQPRQQQRQPWWHSWSMVRAWWAHPLDWNIVQPGPSIPPTGWF